jgi:hypothetical protein
MPMMLCFGYLGLFATTFSQFVVVSVASMTPSSSLDFPISQKHAPTLCGIPKQILVVMDQIWLNQ